MQVNSKIKLVLVQHYHDKWVECCESEPIHVRAMYKHCAGATSVRQSVFDDEVRFTLFCHGIQSFDMREKDQ